MTMTMPKVLRESRSGRGLNRILTGQRKMKSAKFGDGLLSPYLEFRRLQTYAPTLQAGMSAIHFMDCLRQNS